MKKQLANSKQYVTPVRDDNQTPIISSARRQVRYRDRMTIQKEAALRQKDEIRRTPVDKQKGKK